MVAKAASCTRGTFNKGSHVRHDSHTIHMKIGRLAQIVQEDKFKTIIEEQKVGLDNVISKALEAHKPTQSLPETNTN